MVRQRSEIDAPLLPAGAHLSALEDYLSKQIGPQANAMDADPVRLAKAFDGLGKLRLLAVKASSDLGGLSYNSLDYARFQSLIGRYSGALAFLQTQHQSAVGFLLTSPNEALRHHYLPAMATGQKRLGIGFSHLRRDSSPLSAIAVENGYCFQGKIPWVTGAGLFESVIAAAILPDGTAVFALLPLQSQSQPDGGSVSMSEPMALAAMAASNTVSLAVHDWRISSDWVVDLKPPGWIRQRDRDFPLSPMGLILGCTRASLDVLAQAIQHRQLATDAEQTLKQKLAQIQTAFMQAHLRPDELSYGDKITLRANAVSLMYQAAQSAVIATSGGANRLSHPAQRVYREAMVLSVSGQTTDIMQATLGMIAAESARGTDA